MAKVLVIITEIELMLSVYRHQLLSSRSIVYEVLDVANYKSIPQVTSSYPFHEGRGMLAS
jgi:hypothetical protein